MNSNGKRLLLDSYPIKGSYSGQLGLCWSCHRSFWLDNVTPHNFIPNQFTHPGCNMGNDLRHARQRYINEISSL